MNAKDLTALRQGAVTAFRELPMGTLEGGAKPLDADDHRLLAIYESAVQLLNSKGLLVSDGAILARPRFVQVDSCPPEDDYL